jgi:concentrative nucleoside transporter, CNT family
LDRFTGVLGILAVLLAAWLGSTDRKRIRWRTVAWGLGLQSALPSWCCASTTASAP